MLFEFIASLRIIREKREYLRVFNTCEALMSWASEQRASAVYFIPDVVQVAAFTEFMIAVCCPDGFLSRKFKHANLAVEIVLAI